MECGVCHTVALSQDGGVFVAGKEDEAGTRVHWQFDLVAALRKLKVVSVACGGTELMPSLFALVKPQR